MQSTSNLTSDDKVWAAIAHASVLFSFWGPLVPAILWFLFRRKSEHVRFHALQALTYQISSFWLAMIVMPILMIVMFAAVIVATAQVESHRSGAADVLEPAALMLFYLPLIGVWALYMLVGLMGAVAVLMGRNFRYPLLGGRLQRKLGYQALNDSGLVEAQEDQVIAAVSHATCIIPMLGVVLPLIIWVTQKDRGGFIRFQSLQALIYQGLGSVAYVLGWGLYMLMSLGMLGVGLLGASSSRASSPEDLTALLVFLVPLTCLILVLLLGGPLFHLFGFIASLRVLRGGDYNYPLLGRYLRKRTETTTPAATEAVT